MQLYTPLRECGPTLPQGVLAHVETNLDLILIAIMLYCMYSIYNVRSDVRIILCNIEPSMHKLNDLEALTISTYASIETSITACRGYIRDLRINPHAVYTAKEANSGPLR